eukprot:1391375-Heterocapsa_arctica.AAC.1
MEGKVRQSNLKRTTEKLGTSGLINQCAINGVQTIVNTTQQRHVNEHVKQTLRDSVVRCYRRRPLSRESPLLLSLRSTNSHHE